MARFNFDSLNKKWKIFDDALNNVLDDVLDDVCSVPDYCIMDVETSKLPPRPASPAALPRCCGVGRGAYLRQIEAECCIGYTDAQLRSEMRQANICDYSDENILRCFRPQALKPRSYSELAKLMGMRDVFSYDDLQPPLIPISDETDYVRLSPALLTSPNQFDDKIEGPGKLFSSHVRLRFRNALIEGLMKKKQT